MRVFVIDDEEVSIFIIRSMLFHHKVAKEEEITSFLSAQEALDTLMKCKEEAVPDIILLDLAMPIIDGWQLLEALVPFKTKFERCRIHILTSSIVQSDEVRARKHPMVNGFIHKPLRPAEISGL